MNRTVIISPRAFLVKPLRAIVCVFKVGKVAVLGTLICYSFNFMFRKIQERGEKSLRFVGLVGTERESQDSTSM